MRERFGIGTARHMRRIKRTLQTDTVTLETVHSLLEQVLAGRRHSRDVVLVPFNGSVDSLEDLLDGVGDLCADTITGDKRYLQFISRIWC